MYPDLERFKFRFLYFCWWGVTVEEMIFILTFFIVPSAAAKKASCPHPDASRDKDEGVEGQKKEGLNGELEEETNGKVKEGEGAACGSKLRACRRTGAEGSSAGTVFTLD